ncbi:LysE family translocator [Rhodobacter sp. NTK016B]|uniref:LysE family translocator n=1 Tax=Rhodobacter sp. NTK016B TaxID=2759676 RepID=UPI001A8C9084|nr:LysE family translocator [Rhodobacter sp. NTK016B]MBN8293616.1 LysE family translocator [Rhodobacter sp. NTK016B]
MPELHTLITYLAVLTGFVFFPGPSILLTLARASSSGTRVGVATSLGIALGDLMHTALAVVGISAIVLASAEAFFAIKMLGAGYLIWLGLRSLFEGPPDLTRARPLGARRAFRQAMLAEVLNPKSAMFFLAFLPQFVDPALGSVALQLTVLGLLFVAMGTLATLLVALGAGRVSRILQASPAIRRWQGKVVGCVYCALGLRLALQDR